MIFVILMVWNILENKEVILGTFFIREMFHLSCDFLVGIALTALRGEDLHPRAPV